jgi:hypothetical protein
VACVFDRLIAKVVSESQTPQQKKTLLFNRGCSYDQRHFIAENIIYRIIMNPEKFLIVMLIDLRIDDLPGTLVFQ